MEMEYSLAKGVRHGRSLSVITRATSVRRVGNILSGGNRMCGRGCIFGRTPRKVPRGSFKPSSNFVARLPERAIGQANQDGLDPFQRQF